MIDLTDVQSQSHDLATSKQIAERLNAAYPGYLWAVHIQWRQGIATVRNLSLSGVWAFVVHLTLVASASELEAKALRAGGEILERYRMRRGPIDYDAYDSAPLSFDGRMIGDTQ